MIRRARRDCRVTAGASSELAGARTGLAVARPRLAAAFAVAAVLGIAGLAGAFAQTAPPPVAPPEGAPTQPQASPQPGPGSEPESALTLPPAARVVDMDVAPLTPQIDPMQDVQPALGTLARCPGLVAQAAPAFDRPMRHLSWRMESDHALLLGQGEGEYPVVLARLRWGGAVIEWQWVRFSATALAGALAEARQELPWMILRARLGDGTEVVVQAPPLRLERTLSAGSPVVVSIPGGTGRNLTLQAEPSGEWTVAPLPATGPRGAPGISLTCAAGTVNVTLDAAGRLRAQVAGPEGVTLADLRKQVEERTRELRDASPAERRFIEAELADLRARIQRLEQERRSIQERWPPLPRLRACDAQGRDFASLQLQIK